MKTKKALTFLDSTALFHHAIRRMSQHFEVLLQSLLANPEQHPFAAPMLSAGELRQLDAWNNTALDIVKQPIHEVFESFAASQPDAPAVVFAQSPEADLQTLSYAELNAKANQFAHYLREQGVQTGDLVALCVERGVDLPLAFLPF